MGVRILSKNAEVKIAALVFILILLCSLLAFSVKVEAGDTPSKIKRSQRIGVGAGTEEVEETEQVYDPVPTTFNSDNILIVIQYILLSLPPW